MRDTADTLLADIGCGVEDLVFVPLGGAGEIGMNMSLYGHDGRWLMIDCGVTFGDDETPGVDLIMPDPGFAESLGPRLAGLVLTHAHEDHIGAVPYLWRRLRCPLFATPFTAAVLRRKLEEAGLLGEATVTELPMSGTAEIGPFAIQLVTLTHSIPEPNAVILRTKAGTVLHTGDWKLDPEPLVGDTTDEAALRALGEEGVLAMIGDSTNALVEGASGSEAAVRASLMEIAGGYEGRVCITCFASNVARLRTLIEVARAHGRQPALIGRSLWRIVEAARATGYFDYDGALLTDEEARMLPRDKVLLICTGSQGEPRSALARIARDDHPAIRLDAGDVVIFSSRIIPGNEKSIGRLHNQLAAIGVEIITERDHFVHVSGHPARDELIRMYQWVRPHIAVPVHGEMRHMMSHAALASACQVSHAPLVTNGDVLRLAPDGPEILGAVGHGRLALDGTRLVALDAADMRSRRQMLWHGSAVLTLVVDGDGRLVAQPRLSAPGLVDERNPSENGALAVIREAVGAAIDRLDAAARADDGAVVEMARRAVRRYFRERQGKRPVTTVHLVRI